MSHQRGTVEWWAFIAGVFVIGVLATWFLMRTVQKHDYVSATVVVCVGYIALPIIVYWRARHKSRSQADDPETPHDTLK
jgi:formate-dependent nitrite reductase membrane component NrfD